MPPIDLASVGSVTVNVKQLPEDVTLSTSITVLEKSFGTSTFEMRQMFPRWYDTGPRQLELEPSEY
jgi:hypothetical protein